MAIDIQNLTFGYQTNKVFDNLNLSLPDNCLCIADNGAGKTTLLKIIAGILPIESGTILVSKKADFTASLLLNSDFLFDEISVQSHLKWLCDDQHQPWDSIHSIMEDFELEQWLSRFPGALSQGERQWLSLAMILYQKTDIYLLDEPMTHLDSSHRQKLVEILKKYLATRSFLIMSHPGTESEFGDIMNVFKF